MQSVVADIRDEYNGATLVSGTSTTVMGPYNMMRYPRKVITLYNLGPVTASGLVVQINPDPGGTESVDAGAVANQPISSPPAPNPGLWENYDTTTFQSMPAGSVKSLQIANVIAKWWRVQGINQGSATITVSGYIYAATV